jgi:hypothetical protein
MLSMKTLTLAATVAFTAAPVALADQWVDYAPSKQPWEVTTVKVEAGKLDDYLVSLKKSYVEGLEREKTAGDVLEYHILVNSSPNAAGATVVFLTKYKDWSTLEPNKDRDMKEEAEFRKTFSKTDETKLGEDRSKFRTFLDQGTYGDITFLK